MSSMTDEANDTYLHYRKTNTISLLQHHHKTLRKASEAFRKERQRLIEAFHTCEEYENTSISQIYEEHEIEEGKQRFETLRNSICSFTQAKLNLLNVISRYSREVLLVSKLFCHDQDVIDQAKALHRYALEVSKLLKRSSRSVKYYTPSGINSNESAIYSQHSSSRTINSSNHSTSGISITGQTIVSSSTNPLSQNNNYNTEEIQSLWFEKGEYVDKAQRRKKLFQKQSTIKFKSSLLINEINDSKLALKYMSNDVKNDVNIMYHAVKNNGNLLRYASPSLKKNKTIVLAALKTTPSAFKYVSEELQNDEEVLLTAINNTSCNIQDGFSSILRYASDLLLDNKSFMLQVLKNDGRALQRASANLKDDIDVVLTAVRNHGKSLRYASESLRNNEEVVCEAMKQDPNAYLHAHDTMKDSLQIISRCATYLKQSMRSHESITLHEYIAVRIMNSISFHAYVENSKEIFIASKLGLRWDYAIGDLDGETLYCIDNKTNLFPFMLAASSDDADLDTIFQMLTRSSDLVRLYSRISEG